MTDGELDPRDARPLTSREIAKLLAGVTGTLAEWCEPEEIAAAFAHFHKHANVYRLMWEDVHARAFRDAVAKSLLTERDP